MPVPNEPTVIGLVYRVHQAAINIGIDLSPKDAAFIISLFLEGLEDDTTTGALRPIIDAVNSVKNER